MRVAISGTYSCGKTLTSMVLAHHTGLPRSMARTMREIMPEALPGRALHEVTPPEYVQLQVRRHTERAVNEALLGRAFVADGSSLQEWAYAHARLRFGMDPARPGRAVDAAEMGFFGAVTAQLRQVFTQHVRASFDVVVHLRNELAITADGHRPMNDGFRAHCDQLLLGALVELDVPHLVVGGSTVERVLRIVAELGLPVAVAIEDALRLGGAEYSMIDWRLERERVS